MVWPETYVSKEEQRSLERKSLSKSMLSRSTVSQVKEEQDLQQIWKSLQVLNEAWPGAQQRLPPESCWGQNRTIPRQTYGNSNVTHSKCSQHHSEGELGLSSLVQKARNWEKREVPSTGRLQRGSYLQKRWKSHSSGHAETCDYQESRSNSHCSLSGHGLHSRNDSDCCKQRAAKKEKWKRSFCPK